MNELANVRGRAWDDVDVSTLEIENTPGFAGMYGELIRRRKQH